MAGAKRVLVTGASGFVGANLARRLVLDGHQTHLILRPEHHGWRLKELAGQFQTHVADLEDRQAVAQCVRDARPDWVFHLAAYGAYSSQKGIERMIATNLAGTAALLDSCAQQGIEAFVHTGSSSEYGYKDHAAREDEIIHPNSRYAITKAAATHYCSLMAAQQGVKAITVRLYSIYGPYEEPARLIPALVVHGLRNALPPLVSLETARDFVYIDDAVEAMLRVAESGRAGAIYNVCSGIQTRLATVVETARHLMNIAAEPVWANMPARSWDTDVWFGSPDLMANEAGWRAQVSFSEGLRRTVDWMLQHPEWREFYEKRVLGSSAP
jgi:UDP-glucose 4-epimerase